MTVAIELDLLDIDGTLIKPLTGVDDIGWIDAFRGEGRGSLVAHHAHADFDLFTHLRFIRCYLDRAARPDGDFTWIIDEDPYTFAAPGGDADELKILSGPGNLALIGLGSFPGGVAEGTGGHVTFGWVANEWDDSTWTGSVDWGTVEDPDIFTSVNPAFMDSFPDMAAYRIWEGPLIPDGAGGFDHPERTQNWHRRQHTFTQPGRYRIYFAYDDAAEIWWDAQLKGWFNEPMVTTHQFDVEVESGRPYTLAVRAYNGDKGTKPNNPGLLVYTCMTLDNDGNPDQVVFHSEPGVGLWTDVKPQGVTYGYVMGRLFDADQARGCYPMVTRNWTDTHDSLGNPWLTQLDIVQYRDGTPTGEIMRQGWQQFLTDSYMTPDFELVLLQSRGVDRYATVQLTDHEPIPEANDIISSMIKSHASRGNAVRLETRDGFGWATDDAAIAATYRREVAASYGTAGSLEEVATSAVGVLEDLRGAKPHVIEMSDHSPLQPYADFDLGDTIGARESLIGGHLPVRALQFTVSSDRSGNANFDVDLERKL